MNNEHTFQLPDQLSTFAPGVDWLFYFIYWTSVVMFLGITSAALYFTWKYRRSVSPKSEPTGHNVPLEVAWTVAPVILLAMIFHWGFQGYVKLTVVPANAMDIRVRARKWSWDFEYPNGGHSTNSEAPGQPGGLHVPVGRPVRLVISSEDVLHAMYIPGFRVKRDAVPGYYSTLWFEATREGQTHFFCAEYCGAAGNTPAADGSYAGHFNMQGEVHMDSPQAFSAFLEAINGPPSDCPAGANQAACWGEKLYRSQQCFTCHSVNGSPMTGPTWQGIWGRQEHFTDGTTGVVDENYVRESILNPSAHVVQGFQPVMPTFRGTLNDRQLDAIIAYMRTLHN